MEKYNFFLGFLKQSSKRHEIVNSSENENFVITCWF